MHSSTLSLTSAQNEGGWSVPRPGRFTLGERPGTHCTGGWVGPRAGCVCGVDNPTSRPFYPLERPCTHCIGGRVSLRAGLDGCGKSRPAWIISPDRPTRSESLYRLSYPGQRCVEEYIRQREAQTPKQAPLRRQIW